MTYHMILKNMKANKLNIYTQYKLNNHSLNLLFTEQTRKNH